jgi:RNA polymerase sigma-70 factor (ECF subfamily)
MTSLEKVLGEHLPVKANISKEIYERYAPGFLAICLRYCANVKDAEDVLHDGFIKIMKNLHTFKPRSNGSFEGWMKRIMVNTALNFIRDHHLERKFLDVNSYNDEVISIEDEQEDDWFADLAGKIDPEKVMDMILGLPVGYRTVFNMYVFESYTHKEIAKTLKCSENTSKSQLSKARAMLRKMINECYQNRFTKNEQAQTSGR